MTDLTKTLWARVEFRLFCLAVTLSVIARASAAISPTFSVDDLWYLAIPFDFMTVGINAFAEGRFTGPFLAAAQDGLGVTGPRSFTVGFTVLTICIALTAIGICRLWRITDNLRASAVAVIFLVLHPFLTDLFIWKIVFLNGGIPFVLVIGGLLLAPVSRWGCLAAIVLIVAALGIHQIPLQYAAAALMLAVPIQLIRNNFDARAWIAQAISLAVATGIYAAIAKMVMIYYNKTTLIGRDSLIIFSHPSLVLDRIAELFRLTFRDGDLIGPLGHGLLALILCACLYGLTAHRNWPIQRSAGIAISIAAFPTAFLCCVALSVVTLAWIPVYRNMMSVSLLWAAIAVLAISVNVRWMRNTVTALSILIGAQYIAVSNEMLSDQQRANTRDIALMTNIAYDISKLQNFRQVTKIDFIGANKLPLARLRTGADLSTGWNDYGTTISVFSVPWPGYAVQLYNEITGEAVFYSTDREARASAERHCASRGWPDQGSIVGEGERAIVCLSPAVAPVRSPFEPPR